LVFALPDPKFWPYTTAIVPAAMDVPCCFLRLFRYGGVQEIEVARRLGMDDYLRLPMSMAELEYRLERLVPPAGIQSLQCDIPGISIHEQLLLQILRQNRGLPVQRKVLNEICSFHQKSRGLDMCITRLRRRLKSIGADENIRSLRGYGYILEADSRSST
ncbi:MAG: winged helix-turn-helix domain-containing protein, partial [Spirochaeta sp.]